MTSHVQTTAAFLVSPVFGCPVPGGFLYGNRTKSGGRMGGIVPVTAAATMG